MKRTYNQMYIAKFKSEGNRADRYLSHFNLRELNRKSTRDNGLTDTQHNCLKNWSIKKIIEAFFFRNHDEMMIT